MIAGLFSHRRNAAMIFPVLFLIIVMHTSSHAKSISNIRIIEDNGKIVILYDLQSASSELISYQTDIGIEADLKSDQGRQRKILPGVEYVKGHIGEDVVPGRDRKIIWNISDEIEDDFIGSVTIRIISTVHSWRHTLREYHANRRGSGIEILGSPLEEVRIATNTAHQGDELQLPFANDESFFLDKYGIRIYVSTGTLELGAKYEHHFSGLSSDHANGSITNNDCFTFDSRLFIGPFWIGGEVGNHWIQGDGVLGDVLENLELQDETSTWNPNYWYYGISMGIRYTLKSMGGLSFDWNFGQELLGYDEFGQKITYKKKEFRFGYVLNFGDVKKLFGGEVGSRVFVKKQSNQDSAYLPYVQVFRDNVVPAVPGLKFVYIPSGNYKVGTPKNEINRDDITEFDPIEISVDGFFVSTTEVTQEAYNSIIRHDWSCISGPHYPAHSITFDEAAIFCERLSEVDRNFVFSLPTEVEWEIAGLGKLNPSEGPIASPNKKERVNAKKGEFEAAFVLQDFAWFLANRRSSHPEESAQKECNIIGLFDFHGNVAEWCLIDKRLPNPDDSDLLQKAPLRGGSFLSRYERCRIGSRGFEKMDAVESSIGFRIICRRKKTD